MIDLPAIFDDIRPYYQREIPAAMQRIASDPLMDNVIDYFGMRDNADRLKEHIRTIDSIERFQSEVMWPFVKGIIDHSIDRFTYNGTDNVDLSRGLLYVSNHRDIVLDSYLLQLALYEHNIPTTQITFGSNLMKPQFVVDIGRSNKMFKVERKSNNIREFARSSQHLSEYIRYVASHGESLWIAQRNGRTKDGIDATDQGLMKMLSLSAATPDAASFAELGITPVAVSYRYESCDVLKTLELYRSMGSEHYVKGPMEDLNSIVTGITQPKGEVHIEITPTICSDRLAAVANLSKGELNKAVAEMIDRQVLSSYKLFDTNYIAHDIRSRYDRFAGHYTSAERGRFEARIEELHSFGDCDFDTLRNIFLGIYANPVDSKLRFDDKLE